jgi:alpha-L-arabinofuranosidase
MGNYQIDKKKVWKSPTTLVLELFTKYHKGSILKTNVKTDKFISPKLGKQPRYKNNKMIDASATYYKSEICLSIVNKSENKNIELKLPYLDKIDKTFTINGENKTDLNSFKKNNKVKIKKNILKYNLNKIILPPHSINLIILKIVKLLNIKYFFILNIML